MPRQVRDFDAAIAEWNAARDGEPDAVPFVLGGEQFDVPLPLPAGAVLQLGVLANLAPGTPEEYVHTVAMSCFTRFLMAALVPEDHERFETALIRSRLSVAGLQRVIDHIIVESTAAPLAEPPDSPPSAEPGGPPSRVVNWSEGTTAVQDPTVPAGAPPGTSST